MGGKILLHLVPEREVLSDEGEIESGEESSMVDEVLTVGLEVRIRGWHDVGPLEFVQNFDIPLLQVLLSFDGEDGEVAPERSSGRAAWAATQLFAFGHFV